MKSDPIAFILTYSCFAGLPAIDPDAMAQANILVSSWKSSTKTCAQNIPMAATIAKRASVIKDWVAFSQSAKRKKEVKFEKEHRKLVSFHSAICYENSKMSLSKYFL